jgi:hypothetical protein
MHIFTAAVQAGLWGAAGYVAVHLYEDWRRTRKTPTLHTYSNAITGGPRRDR